MIPQEILKKQHQMRIDDVENVGSIYNFEFQCLCGLHGLFVLQSDAEGYQQSHLSLVGIQGTPDPLKGQTDLEKATGMPEHPVQAQGAQTSSASTDTKTKAKPDAKSVS